MERIAELCRIKVLRRGGRHRSADGQHRKTRMASSGNRTWLIAVHDLVRDPGPEEQKMIAKALKSLRSLLNDADAESEWIRWSGKIVLCANLARETSIQIWSSSRAKRPRVVMHVVPVLLKQQTTRWTRFYVPTGDGVHAQMPWETFQRLLKSLGYSRLVGPRTAHLLEPDTADAIQRNWIKWCRSKGNA